MFVSKHITSYDQWEIDVNMFSSRKDCNIKLHSNLKMVPINSTIVLIYSSIVF